MQNHINIPVFMTDCLTFLEVAQIKHPFKGRLSQRVHSKRCYLSW